MSEQGRVDCGQTARKEADSVKNNGRIFVFCFLKKQDFVRVMGWEVRISEIVRQSVMLSARKETSKLADGAAVNHGRRRQREAVCIVVSVFTRVACVNLK